MIESLHQVLERLSAPIARNGVGERLAKSGRAVKIDRDHRVAGAGQRLRIPAVMEVVFDGSLRAAMNHESHRVFPALLEADRLQDPSLDLLAAGAGEMKV